MLIDVNKFLKEGFIMTEFQLTPEARQRLDRIADLTNTPSPTGFTQIIMKKISDHLTAQGIEYQMTPKGGLLVSLAGNNTQEQRYVTAHVDTLGAMVRAIKPDGRLKIDLIGGFSYNSIDGNYCKIYGSRSGKDFDGTILMHQTSVHVYKEARNGERNQDNMEVRLDHEVHNPQDVAELGISVGDFISFDPSVQITETGYIKSRHLDDKVSVALLLEIIERVKAGEVALAHTTHFYISNNEEIGYGGNSNIPAEVVEYLAVDMGALGDDQTSDEYTVSICAKDGSGPYNLQLRNHLVDLCENGSIAYQVDIYPFYSSDASAAMKAGADVRHALIGAGIDASHAYERTHIKSIDATYDLLVAYLTQPMLSIN